MKRFSTYFTILTFMCIAWLFYSLAQPKQTEWTVATLKEYFESKLDALALAIEVKEISIEKRFANTNEWRSSYEDLIKEMQKLITTMQNDYVPRTEILAIQRQLDELKENQKKYENLKQGGSIVWAYVLSGVALVATIISISVVIQKKVIK